MRLLTQLFSYLSTERGKEAQTIFSNLLMMSATLSVSCFRGFNYLEGIIFFLKFFVTRNVKLTQIKSWILLI